MTHPNHSVILHCRLGALHMEQQSQERLLRAEFECCTAAWLLAGAGQRGSASVHLA
jgi:hypothetical protein